VIVLAAARARVRVLTLRRRRRTDLATTVILAGTATKAIIATTVERVTESVGASVKTAGDQI